MIIWFVYNLILKWNGFEKQYKRIQQPYKMKYSMYSSQNIKLIVIIIKWLFRLKSFPLMSVWCHGLGEQPNLFQPSNISFTASCDHSKLHSGGQEMCFRLFLFQNHLSWPQTKPGYGPHIFAERNIGEVTVLCEAGYSWTLLWFSKYFCKYWCLL